MTQDVIPGSRGKTYLEQQALLAKGGSGYEVPSLLEAATCTFLSYVRFRLLLFATVSSSYTSCREGVGGCQTIMGGFFGSGFIIDISTLNDCCVGLAALRKL
jgi:hypothetical protein